MSYGPSLDKSKIIGLVKDTGWNEFLELNRMAFDSYLPRNSESRAISMSLRLIKKIRPADQVGYQLRRCLLLRRRYDLPGQQLCLDRY